MAISGSPKIVRGPSFQFATYLRDELETILCIAESSSDCF